MRLSSFLCLTLWLCSFSLSAQPTYYKMAGDTIVAHHTFLNSSYLLNGKKMNPSVMQWFMSDYPEAYESIRISNISEQVSIASYSLGSIFILSGFIVESRNPRISRELQLWGITGLGGGIVFQIISGRYRRKAVEQYNDQIQYIYQNGQNPVSFQLEIIPAGIKGVVSF